MNLDWPSTTGVLAAHGFYAELDLWAKEHPAVMRDTTRNPMHRGSRVHAACHILAADQELTDGWIDRHPECEGYVLNEKGEPMPRRYITAYRKFKRLHRFKLVAAEPELTCATERYFSHPDELGILDKDPTILEIKTGSAWPTGVDLQTAGQHIALRESTFYLTKLVDSLAKSTIIKRFGLLLKPEGTYELKEFPDPRDMDEFRILVRAYRIRLRRLGA